MSFSPSLSLLRGSVGAAAGFSSLLPNSTHKAISQSFRQIVEGNKGYGGGVVRIDSVEHGPIYEEAFGKVSLKPINFLPSLVHSPTHPSTHTHTHIQQK